MLTQEIECEIIPSPNDLASLEKTGTAKFNQLKSNDDLVEFFRSKPRSEIVVLEEQKSFRHRSKSMKMQSIGSKQSEMTNTLDRADENKTHLGSRILI
jgi:hypothetical protein